MLKPALSDTPPDLAAMRTMGFAERSHYSGARILMEALAILLLSLWTVSSFLRFVAIWFLFAIGGGSNFTWSSTGLLLINEALPYVAVMPLVWWAWALIRNDRMWLLACLPILLLAALFYLQMSSWGGASYYFVQLFQGFPDFWVKG